VALFGDTVAVGAAEEASNATGINGNQGNNLAFDAGAAYVFVHVSSTADFTINPGLNGNWWNGPARNGEGAQIEVSDGGDGSLTFVATLYSYFQGRQIFLIAVGTASGSTADVDVFITEGGLWGDNYDPALVSESQWGTGTFTVDSCDSMAMELKPNAAFEAKGYAYLMYDLVRLTTPAAPCSVDNSN
jgi:hypothetical protein